MASLEGIKGKNESVVSSFTLNFGKDPLDFDQTATFTDVYCCQTITSVILMSFFDRVTSKELPDARFGLPVVRAFEEFPVLVIDGLAVRTELAFIAVHDDV